MKKATALTNEEDLHTMAPGKLPVNLDNEIDTLSSVQVSRELITPNGCHVKMLFPQSSGHGIRREIAQLLLTAFMREKEVEYIS